MQSYAVTQCGFAQNIWVSEAVRGWTKTISLQIFDKMNIEFADTIYLPSIKDEPPAPAFRDGYLHLSRARWHIWGCNHCYFLIEHIQLPISVHFLHTERNHIIIIIFHMITDKHYTMVSLKICQNIRASQMWFIMEKWSLYASTSGSWYHKLTCLSLCRHTVIYRSSDVINNTSDIWCNQCYT